MELPPSVQMSMFDQLFSEILDSTQKHAKLWHALAKAWDEEEEIRKFIAMQGQAPSKAQLKKMKKTQMRDATLKD